MALYILDTCIYGVLVDKNHGEYERVKEIINYAKKHRGKFVTTFIVSYEINQMKEELKPIILPDYFLSNNNTIETVIPEKYVNVGKLAWKYIQELKIDGARKILPDAENYAWAGYAKINAFVTINRRGILSKELQPKIKRINQEMKVKYVEVMTPREFLDFLHPRI